MSVLCRFWVALLGVCGDVCHVDWLGGYCCCIVYVVGGVRCLCCVVCGDLMCVCRILYVLSCVV